MIDLNTPEVRAALLVAVPVLLFAARLIAQGGWLDVTTWPRWAQPIVPFVLAAAPPLILDLQSGVEVLAALQAAGAAGFGSIGLYHAAKRAVPPVGGQMIALIAGGLVAASCHVVRPASNFVAAACELGLADAPEVIAAADTKGVPLAGFVAALCEIPEVIQAFEQAEAERADPVRAAVAAAKAEGAL